MHRTLALLIALGTGAPGCADAWEEPEAWEGEDDELEPEDEGGPKPPADLQAPRRKAPRACEPEAWASMRRTSDSAVLPAYRPWEEAGLVPAQVLTGATTPQALLLARALEHCEFDQWAATCLVGRLETARLEADGWSRDSSRPVFDLWSSMQMSLEDIFLVPPRTEDRLWYGMLALEGITLDARIYAGLSDDAQSWDLDLDHPALGPGEAGAFDERGVTDPLLWAHEGETLLLYVGQQGQDRRPQIGMARYTEQGWQRVSEQPVLGIGEPGNFDGWGTAGPSLLQFDDCQVLYFGALDYDGLASIGVATSEDGHIWDRLDRPVLQAVPYTWEDAGVFDPVVYMHKGEIGLLYRGGSVSDVGGVGLAVLE